MAEAIINFILNIPSKLSELTELKAHVMEILANKNYNYIKSFDDIKDKNIFYESYIEALYANINNEFLVKAMLHDLFKANPKLITIPPTEQLVNKIQLAKTEFSVSWKSKVIL